MDRRRVVERALALGLLAAMAQPVLAAPAGAAPVVLTCGAVITQSVTLGADLACPGGDGLVVDGAGTITVNLNGHTISGGAMPPVGRGITIQNSTLVTVKGGAIDGFRTAVAVFAPVKLTNLTFTGNVSQSPRVGSDIIVAAPVTGKNLHGTGGVSVIPERLTTESTFTDVSFASVVGERMRDTTWLRATLGSVGYVDSNRNVFRKSTIAEIRSSQSDGNSYLNSNLGTFRLFQSRDTVVDGNTFDSGGEVALSMGDVGSQRVQVTNNTFTGYGIGVQFPWAANQLDGTVISGNRFRDNSVAGLYADFSLGDGGAITITGNTFKHNGFANGGVVDRNGSAVDDGVHLLVTPGKAVATLSGNTADRNTDLGIESIGAVDGGGNTAKKNGNPAQCTGVVCL